MKKSILLGAALLTGFSVMAEEPDFWEGDSLRSMKMQEVTVFASKTNALLKDLPNKVEIISKRQIENSGINNLTDLLKTYANVDVIEYPGYNSYFSIRGFKPTEGKYSTVLIDGVPAGTTNMASLSLGDVEQVEVLKGPFSSLYGADAMGGVINIVTKRSTGALSGKAKVAVGSFQSAQGAFQIGGTITGKWNFDASFDYTSQAQSYKIGKHNLLHTDATDKAILGEDTYGVKMNGSRYNGISLKGRLGYDFSPNWTLDFTEMAFIGKDLPTGGNVWGANGLKKKDVTRYTSKLELKGQVKNHHIFVAPHYTESANLTYNNDADTAYVTTDSKLRTFGFTAQDNVSLGKQSLAFGIDQKTSENKLKSFSYRDVIKAAYKPNYTDASWGIFAQSNLKLFRDRLNLSVGVRYDHINFTLEKTPGLDNDKKSESYDTFNPNLGAKFNLTRALGLHTSFGTAFSMPDAYQKAGQYLYNGTITVGNQDLKPEKSRTWDAGISYDRPQAGLHLDATFFYTWNEDLIVEDTWKEDGQSYKTYQNADKARKSGLELAASYDLGTLFEKDFSLKVYGNLTWMFKYEDQSKGVWSKTLSVRKQNANFGISYLHQNGLSAGLNGRFMGHRIEKNFIAAKYRPTLKDLQSETQTDLLANSLIEHPAFLIFDLQAAYPVKENLSVGLNVNNLFDENYTEKDGYNMPGRSFTVKAVLNF